MRVDKKKKKELAARIVTSWLIPLAITFVVLFGIAYFCLENNRKTILLISVIVIFIVWAVILFFRMVRWANKKLWSNSGENK